MGVERTIRHDPASVPAWGAICDRLTALGEKPVLRMIDGLPAFPDEVPDTGWADLRVGLAGGMVTLRRQPGRLVCVTWGTDDPALHRSADSLIYAAAAAVGGAIDTDAGPLTANAFARRAGLPAGSE